MPKRKVNDMSLFKTHLLLIGQVEPTELQEGTYLQTPCKPKPKDLSALCVYDYLYITTCLLCILVHNIITSYHSIFVIQWEN